MKKVAIDIDYLIRDWQTALIGIYKKQIDDTWDKDLSKLEPYELDYFLWKQFPFPVYEETEMETDDIDIMEKILVLDESKEYEPNESLFNQFIQDNILEIYGYAKEASPNVGIYINRFVYQKRDKVQLTLFSKIIGKGRPATLFFLSKLGIECPTVKFIDSHFDLNDYDIVYSHENYDYNEPFKPEFNVIKNIKEIENNI